MKGQVSEKVVLKKNGNGGGGGGLLHRNMRHISEKIVMRGVGGGDEGVLVSHGVTRRDRFQRKIILKERGPW